MEQLITGIPTTFIGWIGTIIITISSVTYFFSKIRKNDMQILRDSNADLRFAHEDNVKQLSQMRVEIDSLTTKVKQLEHANKTLEDLVVVALKQFFFENPTVANDLHKNIGKE